MARKTATKRKATTAKRGTRRNFIADPVSLMYAGGLANSAVSAMPSAGKVRGFLYGKENPGKVFAFKRINYTSAQGEPAYQIFIGSNTKGGNKLSGVDTVYGESRVQGWRDFYVKKGWTEVSAAQQNPEDIEFLNDIAPAPSLGHLGFTDDGIELFTRDGYVYRAFSATPVFADGYRMGTVDGVLDEQPAQLVNPKRLRSDKGAMYRAPGTPMNYDGTMGMFTVRVVKWGAGEPDRYGNSTSHALVVKPNGKELLAGIWELRDVTDVTEWQDNWDRMARRTSNPYSRRNGDTTAPSTGDVSSPTSTSADVSSPTSTKTATDAYTGRNITVTGGAGAGATNVTIMHQPDGPEMIGRSYRSMNGDLVDLPMQAQFRDKTPVLQSRFQGEENPFVGSEPRISYSQAVGMRGSSKQTILAAKAYARMLSKQGHVPTIYSVRSDADGRHLFFLVSYADGPKLQANPRNRRNPEDLAHAVYEEFHGAPPAEILEIEETEHVHGHLAGIGDLVSMDVKLSGGKKAGGKVTLTAPDPAKAPDVDIVRVACNEVKNQLYFVGGDQSIDVTAIGFRDSFDVKHDGETFEATELKDLMVIGEVCKLTYRTQKGFDNFEDIDYFHKVGEDTKVRPFLLYDTLNQKMKLAGGEYTIHEKGIVN